MTHAHIFYSGTVQGVGFRYTARNYAVRLGLTGWVKNLPDGNVEIFVQGKKEVIEELLAKLGKHFEGFIKDRHVDFVDAHHHLKSFEIAH